MHKNTISSRFIVAFKIKTCSTKQLSNIFSKVFKLIYNHVDNFRNKNQFYSSFQKFWVLQNSFPIINTLNKINARKKAKIMSTFDFRTFYTIPHNLLLKILSEIIKFVFKSKTCTRVGFSWTSVHWKSKGSCKRYFTGATLLSVV